MKSYHFFLKDLFDTGMGTVEPAVCTVYGSPYRWGSEGGFGGVRTSRYQYVQGKKVFSRGGLLSTEYRRFITIIIAVIIL